MVSGEGGPRIQRRHSLCGNDPHIYERAMSNRRNCRTTLTLAVLIFACSFAGSAAEKPRARDAGIPFEGSPGPLNAITDVAGVKVGHSTIIQGEGKLVVGSGPIRTGVTAVLPRGRDWTDPVFGAWFSLNGNGEMTGTPWLEESGFLEGPRSEEHTSELQSRLHLVCR